MASRYSDAIDMFTIIARELSYEYLRN